MLRQGGAKGCCCGVRDGDSCQKWGRSPTWMCLVDDWLAKYQGSRRPLSERNNNGVAMWETRLDEDAGA